MVSSTKSVITINYSLPLISMLLGIGIDVFVNLTNNYIAAVSDAYSEGIYASIITISVLCFSFIALISGMLDRVYYGYALKEILQFKTSPINFKKYIIYSLIIIIIATIAFALNYVNCLSLLLGGLVYLEGEVAVSIYNLMTSDKLCRKLVLEQYKASYKNGDIDYVLFKTDIDKLISEMNKSILNKDIDSKNQICDMLSELCSYIKEDSERKCYDYLNSKIREIIYEYVIAFGYNEMIRDVIKIYDVLSDLHYVRIDLYLIPINKMRFWDDEMLITFDLFNEINSMYFLEEYKSEKLNNDECSRLLYSYFKNIQENQICSSRVKNRLLKDYFNCITKFYWENNSNTQSPEYSALLDVFKYHIFRNEEYKKDNVDERNNLFKIALEEIINNSFHPTKEFHNFISQILQAFYSHIYMETEVLTESYRQSLSKIFVLKLSTPSFSEVQFSDIVKHNIKDILISIGKYVSSRDDYTRSYFDYFPSHTIAKYVIWTKEFDVTFLLMLYAIYNDRVGYYNICSFVSGWDKLKKQHRNSILKMILQNFDFGLKTLKKSFEDSCLKFAELLNHNHYIPVQNQIKLFELLQKNQEEIIQEILEENEGDKSDTLDSISVYTKICDLMDKDGIYGWDSSYYNESYIKVSTRIDYCRKEFVNELSTARFLQQSVLNYFERFIKKYSNRLILTFNEEGIIDMNNFLEKTNYDSRNYSYSEDWALIKFKEREDFKQLVAKETSVTLIKTPQISTDIYFKSDKFKFNVKLSKVTHKSLTDKECVEFVEGSKSYNGLYEIDGALMSKENAVKSIKKIFCKRSMSFKLMVAFDKNDITCIEFKH